MPVTHVCILITIGDTVAASDAQDRCDPSGQRITGGEVFCTLFIRIANRIVELSQLQINF